MAMHFSICTQMAKLSTSSKFYSKNNNWKEVDVNFYQSQLTKRVNLLYSLRRVSLLKLLLKAKLLVKLRAVQNLLNSATKFVRFLAIKNVQFACKTSLNPIYKTSKSFSCLARATIDSTTSAFSLGFLSAPNVLSAEHKSEQGTKRTV